MKGKWHKLGSPPYLGYGTGKTVAVIPITEQSLSVKSDEGPSIVDSIELHRQVKASGKFNFLDTRCPVNSQLKPYTWEKMLQGYWDAQPFHLI